MGKNINKQSLLEVCCLGTFSLAMFYLLVSGKYISYVKPQMAPYLIFCSAIMLIWAVSKLSEIYRPQHKVRAIHCLVLIVPILFIVLPHSAVSSSGFSSLKLEGGIGGAGGSLTQNSKPVTSGSVTSEAVPTPTASQGAQASNDLIKKYNLELAPDGSIDVPHEKYYQWLIEIYNNMNKYEGVKISIRGFIFREATTMGSNEFVPARMLMSCCAADLVPCGIICKYDKAAELKDGSWVTVTGIIHIGDYQGNKEPQISVVSVSPADKPKEEYVYPVY